jgi:hypothetical protein
MLTADYADDADPAMQDRKDPWPPKGTKGAKKNPTVFTRLEPLGKWRKEFGGAKGS